MRLLRRKDSATLASGLRDFAGLENSMADKKIRLFPFLAGVFLFFPIARRPRTMELKNLNLFPPARAAVPKFPDADDCRCSNAFALAAFGRLIFPARQTPHAHRP